MADFQQGGWYNGQQYWDGSFGKAGEFNPNNNQEGQHGGPAWVAPENQAYVNQQRANPTPPSLPNPQPSSSSNFGANSPYGPGLNLILIYGGLKEFLFTLALIFGVPGNISSRIPTSR